MARRLAVLFVPFLLLAVACSNEGSPAIKAASTTIRPTTSTTAGSDATTSTTAAAKPGTTVTTTPAGPGIAMTGPVGSGSVTYSLEAARSEFCYRLSVKGIGKPSKASVVRSTGEVALDLTPPGEDATVNTCAATDSLFIDEVKSNPGNFTVVVTGAKGTLKATLK